MKSIGQKVRIYAVYRVAPPRRATTRCSTEPPVSPRSVAVFSSCIALPPKTSRCCEGGIPSFSSTRSLIREILSEGSISSSISLPVKVLILTSMAAWKRWRRRATRM